ncbi:hypothetical protein [Rhodopila globiformis]|uniref:hypothetical protein n=1 Tax=Rhodopila globiformis TaxID=1071 RepID=UPI001304B288|nr:hypothetical protein [Rhodopila globiformis]
MMHLTTRKALTITFYRQYFILPNGHAFPGATLIVRKTCFCRPPAEPADHPTHITE